MICKEPHRYDEIYKDLPEDQGGEGRHRCCGCAYDRGHSAGLQREEKFDLKLDELDESQAGTVRHKSPHEAWALGYLQGVRDSYA